MSNSFSAGVASRQPADFLSQDRAANVDFALQGWEASCQDSTHLRCRDAPALPKSQSMNAPLTDCPPDAFGVVLDFLRRFLDGQRGLDW